MLCLIFRRKGKIELKKKGPALKHLAAGYIIPVRAFIIICPHSDLVFDLVFIFFKVFIDLGKPCGRDLVLE